MSPVNIQFCYETKFDSTISFAEELNKWNEINLAASIPLFILIALVKKIDNTFDQFVLNLFKQFFR